MGVCAWGYGELCFFYGQAVVVVVVVGMWGFGGHGGCGVLVD